ncbi:MAG: sulfatase-like hydrolase/transferase [Gemmatimonadaceae bacterium]
MRSSNYFDAHEPYRPPAPYDTLFAPRSARYWHDEVPRPYSPSELQQTRAVYDEAIRYLDDQLRSLLDQLRTLGELENTVVIVTADHGEEFGEHDPSLVAHSLTLHTTSTLVPLVVVYPRRLAAGRRVQDPVSVRDLPATIMDLVGSPTGHPFPGVSLAGYGRDSSSRPLPTPRVMTVEKKRTGTLPSWTANAGNLYSVVDGHLQYILDAQSQNQLFDLSIDPWERHNLADRAEMRDTVTRMRAILDSLVAGPDGKLRPRAPARGVQFGGGKFIRRR